MLNYRNMHGAAITLVGIAARAANDRPEAIAALWQRFETEHILASIPHRVSDDVYALYTDYEADQHGEYTLLIGCAVERHDGLPDGLVARSIPAADYALVDASGPQPQSIVAAWQSIWAGDLKRAYSNDFDLYSAAEPGRVTVHVALRP